MPGYLERINKLKMAGKLESTPNTPSRGGDLGIPNIAEFVAISGTQGHRRTRIDTQY